MKFPLFVLSVIAQSLLAPVTSTSLLVDDSSVRIGNGGNCIGVKSCRPRCITFSINRTVTDCQVRTGAFDDDIRRTTNTLTPWEIKRFRTEHCDNDTLLPRKLYIRVGEAGYSGSKFYTIVRLAEDEDMFTFCSIYPCPKDECALPEQLVSFFLAGE